ncbi:unnamed protein product, partial [Cyprideis torosa]
YDTRHGGAIYLVESPEDVLTLSVNNPDRLAYVTQTTLSVDDTSKVIDSLRERFPAILGPRKDDICYATQNRQDAVKSLSPECDLLLVVGSPNSSNSNRLREIASNQGIAAYLIDSADDLKPEWLDGVKKVGLTAGASAPEILVNRVVDKLTKLGASVIYEHKTVDENVSFALPKALRPISK